MRAYGDNVDFNERIEKYIDKILPYATLVLWLSALAIVFSSIPLFYLWLDLIFGLVFLMAYVFRRKLAVEVKITLTMIVSYTVGIVSFLDGGFNSAGVTLILISNVLGVMLLPRRLSLFTGAISLFSITGLWMWFRSIGHMANIEDAIFIIQIMAMSIFLLVLHVVVYTVKHFLDLSIVELKDTLNTVNDLAYYDQLTGLENVYMMGNRMDNNAEELGNAGYVIMVKISNLRAMNTVHGDEAVDILLQTLAKRVMNCTNEVDRVARIDGSTVAIWCCGDEEIDISNRLVVLDETLSFEMKYEDSVLRPSLYIAYARHDGGLHRKTYEKARFAMFYAMEKEIRTPLLYNRQHSKGFKERQRFKEKIYDLLEEKTFYAAYQPKIDINTGKVIGVEALARWRTKEGKMISPSVFIPLIEEMNKVVTFSYEMIDKIFADWRRLEDYYGEGISVSINISPAVILSPDFCQRLMEKTKKAKIPNEAIVLEITEEIMINDWEKVGIIQQGLKDAGFKLSLDDFGSGYASFTYLVEMAFDEIKIDKSLVWALEADGTEAMISAIIKMAEGLKIDLIAEGVETEEQKMALKALGCKYMQGFLFARPESLNDIEYASLNN